MKTDLNSDSSPKSDPTLQKLETRIRKLEREVEQFGFVANHNLKEPLKLTALQLELLLHRASNKLDEKENELVNNVLKQTREGLQMLDTFLVYCLASRASSDEDPTDLNELVSGTLEKLKSELQRTNAKYKIHPLPRAIVDSILMEEVFKQLISNALKFSQNAPEFEMGSIPSSEEIVVYIKDKGIGIPDSEIENIFEPFVKLHTKSDYPGMGLGLAFCRKVIGRLKGRVWAESKEGQGSTFFLSVPRP